MPRTNVFTTAKRIRRQVGNGHREETGVLLAAIDDATDTLQFKTTLPSSVQAGVTLGLDLELVLVVTADHETNICTVIRGFLDSEPVAHLIDTLIEIAPRFTLLDIVDAMITEVDSWGPDLYYYDTVFFDVESGTEVLGLPGSYYNVIRILECRQEEANGEQSVWPRIKHKLLRGVVGSDWGDSGLALRFHEPVRHGRIAVTIAYPFDTTFFDGDHDLVLDLHFSKSMIDIIEMGARIRLISNSDDESTGRNAQDEPRRAAEVPIGSMVSLSQLRLARYTRRLSDEKARLNRLFPTRMS